MRRRANLIVALIGAVALAYLAWRVMLAWPTSSTVGLFKTQPTRTPVATFTPVGALAPGRATATPTLEQPTPQPTRVRSGIPILPPVALNGLSFDHIVTVSEAAWRNMQSIFDRGQTLGRNPKAFSKVGDSTMVWPVFLAAFDDPRAYQLGPFIDLQATINHFAGSFARESLAVRIGMHTYSEFDPTWAQKDVCKSGEGPLACELRVHNPSVAIIRLGTNDALDARGFETNMRRLIEYCIANGVVPVLGTKPDRVEGADNTINKIIYQLAGVYNIPVWDYDILAGTVPGKGLQPDAMHFLAGGPHDYGSAATFGFADSLQDLSALILLDVIRSQIQR